MIIFKKAEALYQHIALLKLQNKIIGFVPTMGALHQGHLSLLQACKLECDITVCSIFVNPTQFNDPEDFKKYPITIEQDIMLLTQQSADILFLPSVNEIYPDGVTNLPHYNLGEIENILEGKYRPNHFQGVCQVVDRLFTIVQPHKVFFGRKDYQQCMVINKLIAIKQLPIKMYIQPTLREEDGLAMSSRNVRLSKDGRKKATALYQTLLYIKHQAAEKDIALIKMEATKQLLSAGFEKIDYLFIGDEKTLQEIQSIHPLTKAVILGVAYMEGVRLIDNISL